MNSKLPKYAMVGNTAMRLDTFNSYTYWRDAGMWGVKHKWLEDGTLVSISPFGEKDGKLSNLPIIKITKKEWTKSN